ncbi:hypothetical protein SAMN05660903_02920 [Salegentibacter salinarum]|nr:hypothetical protein SAMN05660903_02920 [Salegentibacter salinarum]
MQKTPNGFKPLGAFLWKIFPKNSFKSNKPEKVTLSLAYS